MPKLGMCDFAEPDVGQAFRKPVGTDFAQFLLTKPESRPTGLTYNPARHEHFQLPHLRQDGMRVGTGESRPGTIIYDVSCQL